MKSPGNIPASVRQRLLNRAKNDRRPFNELFQYYSMEVPGHFTFKRGGTGHFHFGLVQGEMDCRMETVNGRDKTSQIP